MVVVVVGVEVGVGVEDDHLARVMSPNEGRVKIETAEDPEDDEAVRVPQLP